MSAEILSLRGRVVIVGAGIAGLMTALELAPRPVVLLSKGTLGAESSTLWAQGGLAAAMGAGDSPVLHAADTLAAGDGLGDAAIVDEFTRVAPAAILRLARLGVRFDRADDGGFALGLEAAHTRVRIVHAGGDGAGRELMRALIAAARATPSIEILERFEARRLIVEDNAIRGLLAAGPAGQRCCRPKSRDCDRRDRRALRREHQSARQLRPGRGPRRTRRRRTRRHGIRAVPPDRARCRPRPMPLASEAVRGEGATLIDETGERFMLERLALNLRRATWWRAPSGGSRAEGHRVFLDARKAIGAGFATRFPIIAAACRAAASTRRASRSRCSPSQHYHMGGVAADAQGRSSIEGLWACGEAASTGLHGANRLASNSLSEAAVFAAIVARSIEGAPTRATALLRNFAAPLAPDPAAVRPILSRAGGVMREGDALRAAVGPLAALARSAGPAANPALVALAIVVSALRREASVGAHCRLDFPERPALPRRSRITLNEALAEAAAVAPDNLLKRA